MLYGIQSVLLGSSGKIKLTEMAFKSVTHLKSLHIRVKVLSVALYAATYNLHNLSGVIQVEGEPLPLICASRPAPGLITRLSPGDVWASHAPIPAQQHTITPVIVPSYIDPSVRPVIFRCLINGTSMFACEHIILLKEPRWAPVCP